MKILSLECSARSASCAIIDEDNIVASSFVNVGLTHSETLMPMVSNMLNNSKTDIKDIDAFAISAGPGSFTGIRIGISAIKGMAIALNTPCVAVSTLEAIAYNFIESDALVCSVMDARCQQVYTALFRVSKGKVKRITPDAALSIHELSKKIKSSKVKCPIIIAGDGAQLFYPFVKDKKNTILANNKDRFQNAVGVCLCANLKVKNADTISCEKILPIYLRLPQAQRELKAKQLKNN